MLTNSIPMSIEHTLVIISCFCLLSALLFYMDARQDIEKLGQTYIKNCIENEAMKKKLSENSTITYTDIQVVQTQKETLCMEMEYYD